MQECDTLVPYRRQTIKQVQENSSLKEFLASNTLHFLTAAGVHNRYLQPCFLQDLHLIHRQATCSAGIHTRCRSISNAFCDTFCSASALLSSSHAWL